MIKTKKNGFLKAAGIMLAVMMLATCVIAGTLAKYTTTSGDLTATAKVAKWNITAGSGKLADLKDLEFKIYDTNGGTATADNEVNTGLIAPGTWGFASAQITNSGEVDATVTAKYTAGGKELPQGMTVVVLSEEEDLTNPAQVTGGTTLSPVDLEPGQSTHVVIAFKWDFDTTEPEGQHDKNDTEFGDGANTDANLELGSLAITATQKD